MKKLEAYVRKGSFYKAVVEDGSDIIFIVDFDGNILYHNASVHETLGYRAKSLIGKNFFDFILPSSLEEFKSNFKQTQKRAYTEKVEFQFLCKDRNYRFLEFNAINLRNKEGLPGLILDCRDITQRKDDAVELLRAQKAKEQFLANISHEIRTPINGIAGIAGLLSKNQNPEEREMYLNAIRHSSENLKVIINDILDLAAIDSGKLKFEKIAFNLKDLLPSLISTFTYQAREKNLALHYTIDESLNKILLGDPVRLNQVLINLISNAVKFTHTGAIHVACQMEKLHKGVCHVRISVKDTGVGIPAEKLNTIFESFSQADESVTRRYGGSGLGLTIARQLVELQNGRIEVQSQEHIGSTFTVHIPYAVGSTKVSKQTPHIASHVDVTTRNVRVLLVEDNDINRLYAKSILQTWKCNTDIAENGLIAIEKLKSNSYDVILMDVQMPVMDGYEATKAIRMMPQPTGNTPIVALTANATKIDVEKCLVAGMNDYLSKPFTPEDLYEMLFEKLKIVPASASEVKPATSRQFDLAYLRNISGNNHEFIKEMLQTFVQSIPNSLTEMEEALTLSDFIKISRVAHQIKPSMTLLGINELKDSAMHIEELAKGTTSPSLELQLSVMEFSQACREVINDLAEELKKY